MYLKPVVSDCFCTLSYLSVEISVDILSIASGNVNHRPPLSLDRVRAVVAATLPPVPQSITPSGGLRYYSHTVKQKSLPFREGGYWAGLGGYEERSLTAVVIPIPTAGYRTDSRLHH